MASQQYTFETLAQLSHTAGSMHFIYDTNEDHYRITNSLDFGGSNQYSSKGRLQTSDSETVFFNTFQYGKETDIWEEYVTGGASGIFNTDINRVDMSVNEISGSEIIRQTINVQKYIPSRSCSLSFAIKINSPVSGIRKRFGLFEAEDGFYFEDGGNGEYYCVLRSSISGSVNEIRVPRSEWNGDKLDGNGQSKIIADPTKQQLVVFDYEWYGAGSVSTNWVIDGKKRLIHRFDSANNFDGPWCKTPFLPIRLEMKNTSGGQETGRYYLNHGSNSLTIEGRSATLGVPVSLSTPIVGISMPKNNYYPLMSLRLKTQSLKGIVLPQKFQISNIDKDADLFYKVIKNANLETVNWIDHPDPNSFVQYDMSSTGIVTQGQEIDNGIVAYGGGGAQIKLNPAISYQIGRTGVGPDSIAEFSETYTIAVAHNGVNDRSINGSMTWIEQR